jgi:hydroxyacylglutathione hydrolase
MKIAERIHIVGSGQSGFHLSDDYDCHVYLLDGGAEYALIDAGGGRDPDAIVRLIEADGLDPRRVRTMLLTHAHADHAAGAAGLRERLGLRVLASPEVAKWVAAGDTRAASLDAAKQAGVYPPDFPYPACPVEGTLHDGTTVQVGDLTIEAIATPGHAAGHLSYALRRDGRTSVFCGDAFFFGGKILLQNTWDCSLAESIATVERLAALDVDGLYPGHLTFAVKDGRRQVERAMEYIRKLLPPPQLH